MLLRRRSIRPGCYLFAACLLSLVVMCTAFLTSFGALIASAHKSPRRRSRFTRADGIRSASDSFRLAMGATWLASRSPESCEWSAYVPAIDVPMLVHSSNWSDSRQRLQGGLCLGFANSLPLAVGAMVFEVCQIGVLRREQPVFLGLGLRP